MVIVDLIKGYREANKLDAKQMAKKLKMQYHAYWRFEQGKPLQHRHFILLLKWLLTA